MKNTGNRGVQLIKEFEGFIDHPYDDPVGLCTIGYGHLIAFRQCNQNDWNKFGYITEEEGENMLKKDLSAYESSVNEYVKVPLQQKQFDALVSFTFNVGVNAFRESTLLKKLNGRDYEGASEELLRWNKAGGKEMSGLTRRRKAEKELFDDGTKQLKDTNKLC